MTSGKRITNTVAVAAMCFAALSVSSVVADPITVNNFSFEDPDGNPPPAGWSISAGTAFRSRAWASASDGGRAAWINIGTTGYQDTGVVIELGKTYTLTVDITTRGFAGSVGTFRLYGSTAGYGTAIGTPVAEDSVTAAVNNVWLTDRSVSFTATAAEAGQTLGIALSTTAVTQTEWDNIRLDVVAPPATPGTLIYGK